MSSTFEATIKELDGARVGSWRWLSRLRRAECASVERFIEQVLAQQQEGAKNAQRGEE